jgi:hypothetical protein
MAVTVYHVERNGDDLHLQAKVSDRNDFALLESLFRDLVASQLCVHTSFGLDREYNAVPAFDYPCRKVLTLIYRKSNGTVRLTPFKKPPVDAANRRALNAELVEQARSNSGGKRPAVRRRTKGKEEPSTEQ